ncbi:unnamed protein product [Cuscuta europaea]|uniref:DUF4283 domain-containing protein n=1 Tax=Cuscuta europaea TaxID=41803 RepID=A0A9P0YL77_CUSEU|nr:unnamed protein product [Cuscuta europaea]
MPKSTAKKKEPQAPTKPSSRLKEKAKNKEVEEALSTMDQVSDSELELDLNASESEESSRPLQPEFAAQPHDPEAPVPLLKQVRDTQNANKESVVINQNVGQVEKQMKEGTTDIVLIENDTVTEPQIQVEGEVNDLYVAALGKTLPFKVAETPISKPYASLFKDNREPTKGMKLRFIEPVGDYVDLLDRSMPSMVEIWGHCLVGYFEGRYPGFKPIQELVSKWGVPCKVRTHDRGWVIFKFQGEEDRSKVLMEGPYTLFGKSLYLKTLSDNFSFESDEFLKVPIWVKFPNLPLQIWNEDVISEIASRVGMPLTTDRVTQERSISKYARVLIEVDASKPPPLTLIVRLPNGRFHFQKMIYETFPNYCFNCKAYGHHAFTCKVLAEMERKEREEKKMQDQGKEDQHKEDKGKGKAPMSNGEAPLENGSIHAAASQGGTSKSTYAVESQGGTSKSTNAAASQGGGHPKTPMPRNWPTLMP